MVCSLLVTAKQYIGDPIDCIIEEIPNNVMDTYCWIHSTFSIPGMHSGREGHEIAHPGVAAPRGDDEEEFKYHKYYQWVCFTLFFQAVLFYIPRYLWKTAEAGKLKILTQDLTNPIIEPDVKEDRLAVLQLYITSNVNHHMFYAFSFFTCELLNLINVIGQIFFLDLFLGGEFTEYGRDVAAMTELPPEQRNDPLSRVFPKVTKCTFHKFGPSGTVEKFDGLCILPLNIINEKIYVFLWFWFIFVTIVSSVHFVFRLATILIPSVRFYLLRVRANEVPPELIDSICRKSNIGNWFLLYQLGKSMDPFHFRQLLEILDREMQPANKAKTHKENGEETQAFELDEKPV